MLQEPISIEQCLKDFTKEEELGDEEMWYCSKCKEHRKIAKKFDIWKFPAILVSVCNCFPVQKFVAMY